LLKTTFHADRQKLLFLQNLANKYLDFYNSGWADFDKDGNLIGVKVNIPEKPKGFDEKVYQARLARQDDARFKINQVGDMFEFLKICYKNLNQFRDLEKKRLREISSSSIPTMQVDLTLANKFVFNN